MKPDDDTDIECDKCDGLGTVYDVDGEEIECHYCDGRGIKEFGP